MEPLLNCRKALVALAACSGLSMPMLALAGAPTPDAHALGTVEAILAYCAKVDPSAAEKYAQQVKALVQGASDDALEAVRASDEYKQARASVDDFVGKVDEHNSKKVCAESVATSR